MSTQRLAWGLMFGLLAAASCSSDGSSSGSNEPIMIALIAPKTGALGAVGQSFERVATVAVDEINSQGGVNGHDLDLLVVDDVSDPAFADVLLNALIDIGVVGVVGPARSDSVGNVVATVKARGVPIISPSSTAQSLETADDGGYMFRNVPNDGFQGLAMAYYLTKKASPAVTHVVLVHEDSGYGKGLADSFTAAFEKPSAGGTVTQTIKFPANLDGAGGTVQTDQVVADIAAAAQTPTLVVLIALEQDALKICQQWDGSTNTGVTWFFTDGARSGGFLNGLPASVVGSLGTAPTNPITGDAYGVLADRYNAKNTDDIDAQVYAANVWDAVFLLAAGLAQQEHDFPGEAYGGAHLRDSLTSVSRGGQINHAGQWPDLLDGINSGGDVDYDGASGPCDFDANGEAIGPYEVWKIEGTPGSLSFKQELFLEAGDLATLAGS